MLIIMVRRGAVALTRRQWVTFWSVLAAAAVSAVVLAVTVKVAAGGTALGITAVTLSLMGAIWRARIGR